MKRLGKYEIQEKIGAGGFGTVYRARDPDIGRIVAIKVCNSADDELSQRFLREVRVIGRLQHPNITTVYDFGRSEDKPFIVMEYLEGIDLEDFVKSGDDSEPLAKRVDWLRQVAAGLAHAQAHDIIHRDIKPSNLRLLPDGTVKVMDFGVAKLQLAATRLTKSGMALGTARYMAPEQIDGRPIDGKADVFSFGASAFEVLTREPAFSGDTLTQLLFQILQGEPRPFPTTGQDIPGELRSLIARCLAKHPAERPTFVEIEAELSGFRDQLVGGPTRRVDVTGAEAADAKQRTSAATDGTAAVAAPRDDDRWDAPVEEVPLRPEHDTPAPPPKKATNPWRPVVAAVVLLAVAAGVYLAARAISQRSGPEEMRASRTERAQPPDEPGTAAPEPNSLSELAARRTEEGDLPGALEAIERLPEDAADRGDLLAGLEAAARERAEAARLRAAEAEAPTKADDSYSEGRELLKSAEVETAAGAPASAIREYLEAAAVFEEARLAATEARGEVRTARSEPPASSGGGGGTRSSTPPPPPPVARPSMPGVGERLDGISAETFDELYAALGRPSVVVFGTRSYSGEVNDLEPGPARVSRTDVEVRSGSGSTEIEAQGADQLMLPRGRRLFTDEELLFEQSFVAALGSHGVRVLDRDVLVRQEAARHQDVEMLRQGPLTESLVETFALNQNAEIMVSVDMLGSPARACTSRRHLATAKDPRSGRILATADSDDARERFVKTKVVGTSEGYEKRTTREPFDCRDLAGALVDELLEHLVELHG